MLKQTILKFEWEGEKEPPLRLVVELAMKVLLGFSRFSSAAYPGGELAVDWKNGERKFVTGVNRDALESEVSDASEIHEGPDD